MDTGDDFRYIKSHTNWGRNLYGKWCLVVVTKCLMWVITNEIGEQFFPQTWKNDMCYTTLTALLCVHHVVI